MDGILIAPVAENLLGGLIRANQGGPEHRSKLFQSGLVY